jgi:hypothetical protein
VQTSAQPAEVPIAQPPRAAPAHVQPVATAGAVVCAAPAAKPPPTTVVHQGLRVPMQDKKHAFELQMSGVGSCFGN